MNSLNKVSVHTKFYKFKNALQPFSRKKSKIICLKKNDTVEWLKLGMFDYFD